MEEKQVQQPLREVLPPQRRQEPAGRCPTEGSALRAAAVLRTGSFHSLARPADLLALGSLVGNSALASLLAAAKFPLAQPFLYRPPGQELEPVPVHTQAPALCGRTGFSDGPAGLEPFPAGFAGTGGL